MPSAIANVGQQVADNLFELGKSSATAAVKLGGDVVKDSFEQIAGAPAGVPQTGNPKSEETKGSEEQKAILKQKEKQRYAQVKAELEQYKQRRAELESQIAREKNLENQQKEQKEAVEKQEKESFVQKMLKRVGAGSHGETDRQKE